MKVHSFDKSHWGGWSHVLKCALAVYGKVKKKKIAMFSLCILHTGPSVVQDDDMLKYLEEQYTAVHYKD